MNSNDLANVMGSFIETELNSFEELNKELKEKDKEIERLNKQIEEIQKINLADHKYASEMEDKYITANSIINKLEKWLNEEINNNVDGIKSFGGYQCKRTLDKLNELKGDSSNE